MTYIETKRLKPNKFITEFYGEFSLSKSDDELLYYSIQKYNIKEPLIITSKNEIISGYRRYVVACMLNISKVPVIVEKNITSEEVLIIHHNLQRNKSVVTLAREYDLISKYYGSKQGKKIDNKLKEIREKNKKDLSDSTRKRIFNCFNYLKQLNPKIQDSEIWNELSKDVDKGIKVNTIKKNLEQKIKIKNQKEKSIESNKKFKNIKSDNFNIIQGDSRKVYIELNDNSFQCLITSPPYYNFLSYDGSNKDELPIGEEKSVNDYINSLGDLFLKYKTKMKKKSSIFINIMDKMENGKVLQIPFKLITLMEKNGFDYIQDYIWFKRNPTPNDGKSQNTREYILHFVLKGVSDYYWDSSFLEDVESFNLNYDSIYGTGGKKRKIKNLIIPKETNSNGDLFGGLIETNAFSPANLKKLLAKENLELTHNAMYEIEIPLIFILLTSKINDSVLDIFNGTGTTGIASYLNKRLYTGIEFSENYINISKARYKAILELDSN